MSFLQPINQFLFNSHLKIYQTFQIQDRPFLSLLTISSIYLTLLVPLLLWLRYNLIHIRNSFFPSTYKKVKRPPLVPNYIPFIGNALSLAGDGKFWFDVKRKYGNVVSVVAIGQERVFVLDQTLITYIYKHSKSFDFHWFRKSMQSTVFGTTLESSFDDVMPSRIFPQHMRDTAPNAIKGLISSYVNSLQNEINARLSEIGSGSKEVDFAEYVFDIIFHSASKAFFGPTFPTHKLKKPFLEFDQVFPLLNLDKLPMYLKKSAIKKRDVVLDLLEEWYYGLNEEERKLIAPSALNMVLIYEEQGFSKRDQMTLMLAEFWALQANAPYAGIWTIIHLLRNKAYYNKVNEEISKVIKTLEPPTLTTLLNQPQPQLPSLLPLTNAAFQETLRLNVDTISLRMVYDDIILPGTLCGTEGGYIIKKDEQVLCVNRMLSMDASDEKWGNDAEVWNPDRWFQGKDQMGTMNPFGGGVSMCEGRHFASAEIITFIVAFAALFDAEIVSDKATPDLTRPGLGSQQVAGKIMAKLSERQKEKV